MGKFKQLNFDNELPELTSVNPKIRVYKMNEKCLTREEFIRELALCIYDNEPNTDIRKTIDLVLNDTDMNELVCSRGNTFFSYITNRERKRSRQYNFDGDVVGQYGVDGDISSIVVEKYMETPSRGLRREVGILEDPITGIENDIVEKDISFYIGKISKASNRYGDKLLHMMDLYNVNNLAVLNLYQVKQYYETYIEKGNN